MPIDCILCGCCYCSCPSVWGEENYLGPAALLKAYRFEVDSRDEARKERLPRWDNERGVYRCHTITNCVGGLPEGAQPDRGHPVAQDGGGAAEAVRQGEVTRGDRAG